MADLGAQLRLFDRHRFSILLGALLLFIVLQPVAEGMKSGVGDFILTVGFLLVLVTTIVTVARRGITRVVSCALLIPLAASLLLNLASVEPRLRLVESALGTALLGFIIALVIAYVLRQSRVTWDVVSAALCGYVLLGVTWALLYTIVENGFPGSFIVSSDPSKKLGMLGEDSEESALALYYSFITLTTVGYGDVIPQSAMARMLAVTEGILGQLYMVALVARLVGMHVADTTTRHHDK